MHFLCRPDKRVHFQNGELSYSYWDIENVVRKPKKVTSGALFLRISEYGYRLPFPAELDDNDIELSNAQPTVNGYTYKLKIPPTRVDIHLTVMDFLEVGNAKTSLVCQKWSMENNSLNYFRLKNDISNTNDWLYIKDYSSPTLWPVTKLVQV